MRIILHQNNQKCVSFCWWNFELSSFTEILTEIPEAKWLHSLPGFIGTSKSADRKGQSPKGNNPFSFFLGQHSRCINVIHNIFHKALGQWPLDIKLKAFKNGTIKAVAHDLMKFAQRRFHEALLTLPWQFKTNPFLPWISSSNNFHNLSQFFVFTVIKN